MKRKWTSRFHSPTGLPRVKLCAKTQRELSSRTVAGFFEPLPAASTPQDPTQAVLLDPRSVAELDAAFRRLLSLKRGMQGLAGARGFLGWWEIHRHAYLNRPVIEEFRRSGLTLGELLDDLHLQYRSELEARRDASHLGQLAARVFKNRIFLTATLSLGLLLSRSLGFLWSLMVLGPGVQMINSYTQPVITPLAQTAQQRGAQDLSGVATSIQAWLTDREKLRDIREQLGSTTTKLRGTSFRGLTPAEAQAKWAEFEKTYFDLFMKFNQTLPSHLRDGRGCFRDWLLATPVGFAANLSSFDTQYWIHRRELERLDALGRARALTSGERGLVALHRSSMKTAESRIAGTLAAWKLFEFMYPEFAQEPANAVGRAQLKHNYLAFIQAMRFDVYAGQFAAQMEDVLKQMDAEFLMQDQIASAAGSRAPAGRVVRRD